jgi:hypothetical protein
MLRQQGWRSVTVAWRQNATWAGWQCYSLYHQTVAALRTRLDEQTFVPAWAEGQALALAQVLADALTGTR